MRYVLPRKLKKPKKPLNVVFKGFFHASSASHQTSEPGHQYGRKELFKT